MREDGEVPAKAADHMNITECEKVAGVGSTALAENDFGRELTAPTGSDTVKRSVL
jgi:hypothetical protein